ncbi:MAG: hypothetical protein SRB2_01699 [Desulfobacteraceae bacterium Eth-SRB2]|nr:MAG: hypothetical protein SRB2_01699 [Desulfobacteraceae bacterium Eth-SRB2]
MTNKKMIVALAAVALILVGLVVPAAAVQLKFHGDMNHRFMLGTNHNEFFNAAGDNRVNSIDDGSAYDNFAEIKYRFWFEAVSDDSDYKGVFATEIGGLRFGESKKMGYSGDQINMEVRWGYFDFQLPFAEQKSRVRMGLQPININSFLWQETVGGVKLYGAAGSFDYQLGWLRGYEADVTGDQDADLRNDHDAFYGRLDFKPQEGLNVGLLALWQWNNIDDYDPASGNDYTLSVADWEFKKLSDKEIDVNLVTLGVDGAFKSGDFFAKWDLMYQTGSMDNMEFIDLDGVTNAVDDYDVSAYFLHADLGMKMGKSTLTYTFWYTSGDDDSTDDDLEAFMATDIDRMDDVIITEGGFADDNYFTERHYILDKGFIMNKLAYDYQATEKLKLGVAALYMMTAEDLEYTAANGSLVKEDEIGLEFMGYFKYKLFKNVEWAVNGGFLAAGDAMDYFERDVIQDGNSDEDIWRADMRIRYKF